jgi:AraC family transcriptional regulator
MSPFDVIIVNTGDIHVAALEYRGDHDLLDHAITRFVAWRRQAGLTADKCATYNIFHADPATTPPEDFRIDLCAAAETVPPNDAGFVARTIPGGRCAVVRCSPADQDEAMRWLMSEWLPASGEKQRAFPLYCQRVAFFPLVPEDEAVTDLYLPLA